jgi:hypothetical protein
MEINCTKCVFCELVVKAGDLFTVLDPYGMEVNKSHGNDVYICRALPPITGDWPEVTENDWCGKFQPKENINE